MPYDFDSFIDRRNSGAQKWNVLSEDAIARGIIPFTVADMEISTAPAIKTALQAAVEKGVIGYTGIDDDYFNAVKGWMKRRHNWDVERDWLIYTHGIVAALNLAIQAYSKEGDGVIIQSPVYGPFTYAIQNNKRRVVENPLLYQDGHYTMDFNDLEEKCKDASILLLCSPHNPSGRVWTKEELQTLGEICKRNNVIVIADEIHFDIVFEGHKHTVFATLGEDFMQNCVVCTSTSKSFNVAGMHGSNIFIPNEALRKPFQALLQAQGLQHDIVFFAYPVTIAAYNESEQWLDSLLDYIAETQRQIVAFCKQELPDVTIVELEGTYLNWLDFSYLGLEDSALKELLTKAEFYVNTGGYYGPLGEGFIRTNLASPRKKVLEGFERAAQAIHQL